VSVLTKVAGFPFFLTRVEMNSRVRIPPLPVAEWTQEAHEARAPLGSAPTTMDDGDQSNLVTTLAHHPQLARAFYTFGAHILIHSSLAPRLREIVTLRVSWRYQAEYEWYQHVEIGRQAGLTDAEIEAVKRGPQEAIWCKADRCVLRVADELCAQSKIDDTTWADLKELLNRRQIMDLIFTVGNYVMLAWAITAFGIEIEPQLRSDEHRLA
jgi:alkylhydroperoxidase family enzyme